MDVDSSKAAPKASQASKPNTPQQKTQKAPAGKVLERQNQKRTLWKNAFDSPFTVTWNPIGPEAQQQVIGALSSMLKDVPPRPTKKHPLPASKEPKARDTTLKYSEIVIGLNAVTRALEKDQLRLVVSTRDLSPSRVIQHLPVLCALRKVPICPISMTSQALAKLMGSSELRTVICFGFKRTNDASVWDKIVSLVVSKSPSIDVPWVPTNGTVLQRASEMAIPKLKVSDMKAKRQQTLAKLKVRKIQHTAPIKPPKTTQKAPKKKVQGVTKEKVAI